MGKYQKVYRPDLGISAGTMEANVGRYLRLTTGTARYEPETFSLFVHTNKTKKYTPDWKDGTGRYWEVKGDWLQYAKPDEDIARVLLAAEQYRVPFGIVQAKDILKASSIPHLEHILAQLKIPVLSYWDLERMNIPFWEPLNNTGKGPCPRSKYAIYLDCVRFPDVDKNQVQEIKEDAEWDPVAAEVLRRYRASHRDDAEIGDS